MRWGGDKDILDIQEMVREKLNPSKDVHNLILGLLIGIILCNKNSLTDVSE